MDLLVGALKHAHRDIRWEAARTLRSASLSTESGGKLALQLSTWTSDPDPVVQGELLGFRYRWLGLEDEDLQQALHLARTDREIRLFPHNAAQFEQMARLAREHELALRWLLNSRWEGDWGPFLQGLTEPDGFVLTALEERFDSLSLISQMGSAAQGGLAKALCHDLVRVRLQALRAISTFEALEPNLQETLKWAALHDPAEVVRLRAGELVTT